MPAGRKVSHPRAGGARTETPSEIRPVAGSGGTPRARHGGRIRSPRRRAAASVPPCGTRAAPRWIHGAARAGRLLVLDLVRPAGFAVVRPAPRLLAPVVPPDGQGLAVRVEARPLAARRAVQVRAAEAGLALAVEAGPAAFLFSPAEVARQHLLPVVVE